MTRALRIAGAVLAILVLAIVLVALGFRGAAAWRERLDAASIAPPTGRYVATRAGRVFLQEAGPRDAIPVVLFHGTAAWSELWRQTMTALAGAGFRAIALDIPPFGFSDRYGGYTRAEQAARVADVLDGLAIPAAIIVGHSFGAGAATETVLRFPSRARGLVLVDAALGLTSLPSGAGEPPLFLRSQLSREIVVSLTVTNPLVTRILLAQLIEKEGARHSGVRRDLAETAGYPEDHAGRRQVAALFPVRRHRRDERAPRGLRGHRGPHGDPLGRQGQRHAAFAGAGSPHAHPTLGADRAAGSRPHPADRGSGELQPGPHRPAAHDETCRLTTHGGVP